LERLLPTGRLEIAFQQIRPWGGRGTASAEAAKMNCLLRKCAACSINETVAGQRLSCCKRCGCCEIQAGKGNNAGFYEGRVRLSSLPTTSVRYPVLLQILYFKPVWTSD